MKNYSLFVFLMISILSCQSPTNTSSNPTKKNEKLVQVKKMLQANKDINAYYGDYTLLCGAIKSDQKDIVIYLIENGADLNKMSNKKTPLMYAAKYGRLAIAELLIQKGADKEILSPKGKTALDYAHKYEQAALITFLSK